MTQNLSINTKAQALRNIIKEAANLINYDISSSDFQSWKSKVERFLINTYGDTSFEVKDFKNKSFRYIGTKYIWDHNDRIRYANLNKVQYKKDLETTTNILREYLSEIENNTSQNTINQSENKTLASTKVFIVHGHNETVKIDVARTLEKLGLEAIILHEKTDEGKTIIEKFEKNAINVGFAVILLTADDEGKAKREKDYKNRARQNVVFEMGYFMGKLGRDRVLLLLDKGVEKPGDLDGIVYTPIDEHDAWKYKLCDELKAAGYDVSKDKL